VAFPNPFYQIYEGSAKASRAKIIHMNLTKEGGFKPNLDEDSLTGGRFSSYQYPK